MGKCLGFRINNTELRTRVYEGERTPYKVIAVERDQITSNGSFEVEAIRIRIASLYSLRPRHLGVDYPLLFGTILCRIVSITCYGV